MDRQDRISDIPGVALATSAGISFLRRSAPGEAVVFLHGIGARGASFLPLLPHLRADLDLIFWNAPGYAASPPLDRHWPTEEDYADALLHLFDALGLDRAVLVGHSLGTLTAARFAARHGDRLSGLVLAACAAGYGIPVGDPLPEKTQARIDALETLGGPAFARTRAPRLVHRPEASPEAVATVELAMAAVTMPGYGQAVRMLSSGRLTESLAQVTVPTTFIWAEGDVVTPEAQTLAAIEARTHAGGPAPAYHRIPDAGHAVYLEQPAAFAAVLMTALPGAGGSDRTSQPSSAAAKGGGDD
jgi:pimeloyl-ACP methyl ester carboxylesterase